MSRIRLVVGGGAPVRADRPPIIFAAGFALHARASSNVGTTGVCQMASTAKLTAVPQQGFGNRFAATFALHAAPRFKMDGQAAFALHAAAAAPVLLFVNGYAYARRLVRSAQPDLAGESTLNLPAFLDTSEVPGDWTWLLTGSAKRLSGLVGGFPADVRFETEGGTKLDHWWVSYDPTAGTGRFFIREPAGSTSDTDLRLIVYYGKAGVVATEANVAGVWQGAALVIDPTTGNDLTGKGHAFARSNVSNVVLDGRPAAQFVPGSTTSDLRDTGDLSFLDTLPNLTVEYWATISTTSSGNIDRLGGQAAGTARYSGWAEAIGSAGGKANVLQAGTNWWDGAAQHNEGTESLANMADGSLRHLLIVRQSGQYTQIYDGEANISSGDHANSPTAGTSIHPRTGDDYSLGAGTGAQNTAPSLTLGLYVLYPRALSATWRAMLDRTQRDSSLVWGVGAEDTFGDIAKATDSPVGKPWRQTVTAQTDIDLAPHAYDPDAGSTIVATAVTPPLNPQASYSIVPSTGKLRVSPNAGAPLTVERPVATLSDGTKTAKVSPILTIQGIVVANPEGKAPAFPQPPATNVVGPIALSALQAQYNGLTAAQIAAGVTILVTPGGSITGGLTLAKNGTATKPIVIRVATLSASTIVDPASFPAATIGGIVTFTGAYNWLRGFSVGGTPSTAHTQGSGNRFNRCKFTAATDDYGTFGFYDWCEWTGFAGVMHQFHPLNGSTDNLFYRNYMHDDVGSVAPNLVFLQLGNNPDWNSSGRNHALECLFASNTGGIKEACEMKSQDNILERCAAVAAAGKPLRFNARQSTGNQLLALWFSSGLIIARGGGHIIADCIGPAGASIGPAAGSLTWDAWVVKKLAGTVTATDYPNGEDCRVIRTANPVIGDDAGSGGTDTPPTNTSVEACSGTTTLLNGTLAAEVHTSATTTWPARADGGARNWPVGKVGPNGVYNAAD